MLEKSVGIFHPTIQQRMWSHSIGLSLVIYICALALTVNLAGELGPGPLSGALSITAALLIGFSFSLSGLCYYFDFLDTKIGYRKYLGLMGYWFAVLYSLSLIVIDPDRYLFGFFRNFFTADIIFGLLSIVLFTFMALISNVKAMKLLGPKNWRVALRVGYVAWFLLVLRAYFMEGDLWIRWLEQPDGFPPVRLVLSGYVILVILFRFSIPVAKNIKSRRHSEESSTVDSGPLQ